MADELLPEDPGVYIATTTTPKVMYVGESKNLFSRWNKGHHKALACVRHHAHDLYYFETKQHKELEHLLIAYYRPELNASNSIYKAVKNLDSRSNYLTDSYFESNFNDYLN